MTVTDIVQTDSDEADHTKLSMKEKIRRAKINQDNNDKKMADLRAFAGIREVRPYVDNTDVEEFLDSAVSSKEATVEFLIINSILSQNQYKSVSFQLLSKVSSYAEVKDISNEKRIAVLRAVADATDEMAKLSGSFNASFYNIFYKSASISIKFLSSLPPNSRVSILANMLREGKSYSWLVYFARKVIRDHQIRDTTMFKFVPWLEEDELEIVKKTIIQRLRIIMKKHYDCVSDPFQLHLFWLQIGSDEDRTWLKNWVAVQTKEDEKFLEFVKSFTGSAILSTGKYIPDNVQVAFVENLGLIMDLETLVQRLQEIIQRKKDLGSKAAQLLQTVQYTLSAKEQGLKIISKYR